MDLPKPSPIAQTSLYAALEQRKTTREISDRPLPLQLLSNLLWAADGVNRRDGPMGLTGRTAASASNSQEIDIYVAMKDAIYLYDPFLHRLERKRDGDFRAAAMTPGQRGFDASAPVQLIYVADVHRLTHTRGFDEPSLHEAEGQKSYYFVDTGIIAGNVYLFAAAEGLAAWFHNCDRASLAQKLGLNDEQRPLFAQSVGYPRSGAA